MGRSWEQWEKVVEGGNTGSGDKDWALLPLAKLKMPPPIMQSFIQRICK